VVASTSTSTSTSTARPRREGTATTSLGEAIADAARAELDDPAGPITAGDPAVSPFQAVVFDFSERI
jgi:hypothetical protein